MATLVASAVSVVFGIFVNNLSSDNPISIKIFSANVCISLFIIWFLLIKIFSPDVTYTLANTLILRRFCTDAAGNIFAILSPCNYVSRDTYLTFFYLDNSIETYLATGIISNIQTNGLIKVDLLDDLTQNLYLNKMQSNDITLIKSIIVKPIITNSFIERGNLNVWWYSCYKSNRSI